MSSNEILALIFTLILAAAALFLFGLKRPILAKVVLGVGALVLTLLAYVLHNTVVPAWMLALSGVVLLADAWLHRTK